MVEYKTLNCVCGYHEYISLDGGNGEDLQSERERLQNPMDPYAVVVKKDGVTVG